MPTNLPPDYFAIEKRYRAAKSIAEKIACVQELIRVVPKHKGTDHLRADLRRRLSKLETPPAAPVPAPEEQEKAMQAKLAETAELAAKNALTAFMATLGTPPAAPSAEPAKPAAKKFEELVREHAEYSKNKGAAIKAVVKSNPAEYADYSKRLGAGEVIMF